MIHMTIVVEDTTMIIAEDRSFESNDPMFDVVLTDNLSGKYVKTRWNFNQLNAVVVLLLLGDEPLIAPIQDELYKIAEPLMVGIPNEVRPIP